MEGKGPHALEERGTRGCMRHNLQSLSPLVLHGHIWWARVGDGLKSAKHSRQGVPLVMWAAGWAPSGGLTVATKTASM